MHSMRYSMPMRLGFVGALGLIGGVSTAAPAEDARALPLCTPLSLPVERVSPPPTAYLEFCRRQAAACEMQGPSMLLVDAPVLTTLVAVNQAVNDEIRFMPDPDCVGEEERWSYPVNRKGDCEDMALEKRRRLVAAGLPRAAFTMAIAHHRTQLFSHAILLAETSVGTLVLDNLDTRLRCWDDVPYHFETRERVDGRWWRYDQRAWRITPQAPASSAP